MKFRTTSLLFLCTLASVYPADEVKDPIKQLIDASEVTEVLATGSMVPTFDENYLLICVYRPFKDLKIGDVIIYRRVEPIMVDDVPHFRVCHRVWNVSKPTGAVIIVKGDANQSPDSEYVTESNYECIVVGWVRKDALPPIKDLTTKVQAPIIFKIDAPSHP